MDPSLPASGGISPPDTLIWTCGFPASSSGKLIPHSPYPELPVPSQSDHTLTNTEKFYQDFVIFHCLLFLAQCISISMSFLSAYSLCRGAFFFQLSIPIVLIMKKY